MKRIGIIAALALLCSSASANVVVYNWEGHCTDDTCLEAHATLTFDDTYVPGTEFRCGFVSCPVLAWDWGFTFANHTTETDHLTNQFQNFNGEGILPATTGKGYLFYSNVKYYRCAVHCLPGR